VQRAFELRGRSIPEAKQDRLVTEGAQAMSDLDELDLTVELARDLLMATAPGELPLFEVSASAYRADPESAARGGRPGKDLLGFGADELVAMTPYVLPIASAVVQVLLAELSTAAAARSREAARALLRRLLRRQSAGPSNRPGTNSQGGAADEDEVERSASSLDIGHLARVREAAAATASELGLSPERRELLADAVVGRFAVSS
jgi:hypothetical protein